MKVKIKEIHPNPFKKMINEGKLDENQVKRLMANLKKLKLMGSLPVVKREGKIVLVSHHHRVEALKRVFGKDYEVEVTFHNEYTDEDLFRGMIIENLSQRRGEFQETKDNVVAVRDFLKNHPNELLEVRGESPRSSSKFSHLKSIPVDEVTANDIAEWLDKSSGTVMKKDDILDFLNIADKLAPELQEKIEMTHNKSKGTRQDEEVLNKTQAIMLAGLDDKKEQKDLADALKGAQEQRVREQSKLLTEYKKASEKTKEKVRKGVMKLDDVPVINLKEEIEQKIKAHEDAGEEKLKIVSFHKYQREAGEKVSVANQKMGQAYLFLNALDKSGVLLELDWKTMLMIVDAGIKAGHNYSELLSKVKEAI